MNPTKAQFFGVLLHAATYFKLAHFDVSGPGAYAAHLLFDDLKDKVEEYTDSLVEATTGEEGLFEITVPLTKLQKTPYEFILSLLEYIRGTRKMFEQGYQQSLIDDIEQALATSLYKIKFLK